MRIGILGYPQSGKTTLFNVLARAHAPTGSSGSSSGGVNVGTVQVPDSRLEALRDLFKPKKYTPARIEYVDLAVPPTGRDASAALLPQQITSADMLLVVVRAFPDEAVAHPKGTVDARRDASEFADELVLKDLATLEGRVEKLRKMKQVGRKDAADELVLLERCYSRLEEGLPLRDMGLTEDEERALRGYGLLTAKPMLTLFNVGDTQADGAGLAGSPDPATRRAEVEIAGKAELEIAELPEADAKEFMELMGITESALSRVIRASYDLLGACSFFTVGEDEVRAWTIPAGPGPCVLPEPFTRISNVVLFGRRWWRAGRFSRRVDSPRPRPGICSGSRVRTTK